LKTKGEKQRFDEIIGPWSLLVLPFCTSIGTKAYFVKLTQVSEGGAGRYKQESYLR
jgi:hypothetical protein